MTEWKEYTGSDDQIAEIKANINGYIVRDALGMLSSRVRVAFDSDGVEILPFEYLICDPHPLVDMICQQARTGQPVWVRKLFECGIEKEWQMFVTNTPDWNIPNAEYSFSLFEKDYSFTEFKEEV